MTYSQLITAMTPTSFTSTYYKQFDHAYVVGMNDGGKTYPFLLLQPMFGRWARKHDKKEKLYDVELFLFAESDGMTHVQRNSEWSSQQTSLDSYIASITSSGDIVLTTEPQFTRYEDENAALFNMRCVWTEARFTIKVLDC